MLEVVVIGLHRPDDRVVDQYVEAAVLGEDAVAHPAEIVLADHVHRVGGGGETVGAELLGKSGALVAVTRDDPDLRAGLRESPAEHPAVSPRAAGDQRDSVVQAEEVSDICHGLPFVQY